MNPIFNCGTEILLFLTAGDSAHARKQSHTLRSVRSAHSDAPLFAPNLPDNSQPMLPRPADERS
jgi:hypothetical protein